jgi:hypothetical protein
VTRTGAREWTVKEPGLQAAPIPTAQEIARILWDTAYSGNLVGNFWPDATLANRARYLRMANAVRARYATRCCDIHGRSCEPPYELCCDRCCEAQHVMGDAVRGSHGDGSVCVNPDLSPNCLPEQGYQP